MFRYCTLYTDSTPLPCSGADCTLILYANHVQVLICVGYYEHGEQGCGVDELNCVGPKVTMNLNLSQEHDSTIL